MGFGAREYRLDTPSADRAELDAETYWAATIDATRQALQAPRADPARVAAIAVSSQGETIVPVDGAGRPLGPAIVWLDNRAVDEFRALAEQFDDQALYRHTGVPSMAPTWPACKLLLVAPSGAHGLRRRTEVPARGGLHPPPDGGPLRHGRRRPLHVPALRHPGGRVVGGHARGDRDRAGAPARDRPPGSGCRHADAGGRRRARPPVDRRGRRRWHGPGSRGRGCRQRRGRDHLREHRRGADGPGVGRSPGRRPDGPDARLRPLRAGPLPLLPGLPDRRDGPDLVPRPVRERGRGAARRRPAATPTTC